MSFDSKAFLKTRFEHPTFEFPVPQLAEWFPEGEKPVWVIRGLTGIEIGRCMENSERRRSVDGFKLEAMASGDPAAVLGLIRELFVDRDEVPERVSVRIQYLIEGSVSPRCDLELALKLMQFNGLLAADIANKILELSGRGQVSKKKLPDSGQTPESEPA